MIAAEVVVVIVAAGAGRRLGGVAKALLRAPGADQDAARTADGPTFLARIAATAAGAGAGRAVVVVGPPHGERVAEEARRLGLDLAHNPDPDRGMSSSVAIGFAHCERHFATAAAALLWPVDHARVSLATVAGLIAGAAADPAGVVIPTWRGRGGHPTWFGRALWGELAACAGLPRGARSVVDAVGARVRRLEVADPGVVADVDHPADLG